MKQIILIGFILLCTTVFSKEYHVSKKGNDSNSGNAGAPFLTIQAAANIAQVGDVITVHEGVYRERINPKYGGTGNKNRIVYKAAEGEKVHIKGSEIITGWKKVKGSSVWKVEIQNSIFDDYNPYQDSISGDWFNNWERIHHTGEVFLNGNALLEKETLSKVEDSKNTKAGNKLGNGYTWYCESNDETTTIWANFHDFNPKKELIEISVRPTCFYPKKPGLNYITIKGFEFSQAATQWAAPTAEQVGMIATHWNKGWIIENNIIHDSKCSGITLGKERRTGHNVWLSDKSIDGSVHYIEVTFRALRNGWSKENIGSHTVRNNEIYDCGQTGICGSFGCAFSLIEGNFIHNIYTRRQYSGAELAGIKFHGAVDAIIRKNRIDNCYRGIWLDWMTQGTRVTQNLMLNNDKEDMYFEVNHGPYLVDNNLLLSKVGLVNQSNGGAFVHNLFLGETRIWAEPNRYTPYLLPHSTEIAGVSGIAHGECRFYNNLFVGIGEGKGVDDVGIMLYGLSTFNDSLRLAWGNKSKRKIQVPSYINNNVYLNGAEPYKHEKEYNKLLEINPGFKLLYEDDGVFIEFDLNNDILTCNAQAVTTATLGKTHLSKAPYDNPDQTPLKIDVDYLGEKRDRNLTVGPFQHINQGNQKIKVW